MTKYHISSDGTPKPCKAGEKSCPLGADNPHFKTKEAAREYYEKDNASETIAKPLTKNNLRRTNDPYVRYSAARNPNTPTNVLEKLSKDKSDDVRWSIAENPNTPTHVLKKLSKDEAWRVRANVADNPNTPAQVLVKLSKDNGDEVRASVARNPNAPLHVLERLSNDRNPNVRKTATETLEKL